MADPTAATRRDIADAPPRRHSAREFVDLLSSTIPTGPRHPLVKLGPTGEDRPEDLEVFAAVGFALKRLEGEGRIRTEVADDARERIIFRFPGPTDPYITVTHVEVLG